MVTIFHTVLAWDFPNKITNPQTINNWLLRHIV